MFRKLLCKHLNHPVLYKQIDGFSQNEGHVLEMVCLNVLGCSVVLGVLAVPE